MVMDAAEERKKRLKLMAAQASDASHDAAPSQGVISTKPHGAATNTHHHAGGTTLANPLADPEPSQGPPASFGFYSDPLAAFSRRAPPADALPIPTKLLSDVPPPQPPPGPPPGPTPGPPIPGPRPPPGPPPWQAHGGRHGRGEHYGGHGRGGCRGGRRGGGRGAPHGNHDIGAYVNPSMWGNPWSDLERRAGIAPTDAGHPPADAAVHAAQDGTPPQPR